MLGDQHRIAHLSSYNDGKCNSRISVFFHVSNKIVTQKISHILKTSISPTTFTFSATIWLERAERTTCWFDLSIIKVDFNFQNNSSKTWLQTSSCINSNWIYKTPKWSWSKKHCKNCECCPVFLLIVRSQRLSWIQDLNC